MTAGEGRGGGRRAPEATTPWVTRDGMDVEAPWGVAEHDPMNEGSEETAVPEGRRGERRADEPAGPSGPAGRHGFGPIEPTPTRPAGPGAPPDPAPARRSFPDAADVEERTEDALRTRGRRS
ncbi:hypothetical protein OG989_16790 [Micromonospora sp. NBC_01740]|uniref:hypothetical protein n=1 Tax=Micromonospora sp. NBC_01740 TaxID=2975986 RepID=UPI002E11E807|nr:hypothetical protein OG989_16790 [Micromonospora sp. NBC_01740]